MGRIVTNGDNAASATSAVRPVPKSSSDFLFYVHGVSQSMGV